MIDGDCCKGGVVIWANCTLQINDVTLFDWLTQQEDTYSSRRCLAEAWETENEE